MNRSKDLKSLFRLHMINKRSYSSVSKYSSSSTHQYHNKSASVPSIGVLMRIYFYEWSNIYNSPRCFYSMEGFSNFLKSSCITLDKCLRDIIASLGTAYISCYENSKELCIRSSYTALKQGMEERKTENILKSMTTPKFAYELGGRWSEKEGTFFG